MTHSLERKKSAEIDQDFVVKIKGKALRKASFVSLRRIADNAPFRITTPCILKLPDGLVHVTGAPQEEIDTDIWDVSQKFEIIACQ